MIHDRVKQNSLVMCNLKKLYFSLYWLNLTVDEY